jgi:hypothetical protein
LLSRVISDGACDEFESVALSAVPQADSAIPTISAIASVGMVRFILSPDDAMKRSEFSVRIGVGAGPSSGSFCFSRPSAENGSEPTWRLTLLTIYPISNSPSSTGFDPVVGFGDHWRCFVSDTRRLEDDQSPDA